MHHPVNNGTVGLFGKLPARGDFVRLGLPRLFTEAWDDWFSYVLVSSRAVMGEAWLAAWMEAPVWKFALPSRMCGPFAVLGLWMPSIDRAGRYFPLTLAACWKTAQPQALAHFGPAWLGAAETVGRQAIEASLEPEVVLARLPPAPSLENISDPSPNLTTEPGAGLWWTEGSVRVVTQTMVLGAMPSVDCFTSMLDASWSQHGKGG